MFLDQDNTRFYLLIQKGNTLFRNLGMPQQYVLVILKKQGLITKIKSK